MRLRRDWSPGTWLVAALVFIAIGSLEFLPAARGAPTPTRLVPLVVCCCAAFVCVGRAIATRRLSPPDDAERDGADEVGGDLAPPASDPAQLRRIRRTVFTTGAALEPADIPAAERTLGSLRGSSPSARTARLLAVCFFGLQTYRIGFGSTRHGHWVVFGLGAAFVVLGGVALMANVLIARRLRRAIQRARVNAMPSANE